MGFVVSKEYHDAGVALRRKILGDEHVDKALANEHDLIEYHHVFGHECSYALIWPRKGLAPDIRSLCVVAMAAAITPSSDTFKAHIRGAILNGASRAAVRQTLAMCGYYLGAGSGTDSIKSAWAELGPAAGEPAPKTAGPLHHDEVRSRGLALRKRLFGEDAASSSVHSSDPEEVFDAIKTDYYFGVLWSDEDLALKARCLVAISIFCASNRQRQLRTFIEAARRVECSYLEIKEVCLTACVYAGAAASEDAFMVAREVFEGSPL